MNSDKIIAQEMYKKDVELTSEIYQKGIENLFGVYIFKNIN